MTAAAYLSFWNLAVSRWYVNRGNAVALRAEPAPPSTGSVASTARRSSGISARERQRGKSK